MAFVLPAERVDALFAKLRETYDIFAPKRFPGEGRYSDTDIIRYAPVEHFSDIVWQEKSDFPAKEVVNPIQETIFYFTEDEYRESKGPRKEKLIFLHPCDIVAMHVQDEIFLQNGGKTDSYYQRVRGGLHFAMMDCHGGWDTCFCVSMGSNQADDYALAVKFSEDKMTVTVKDESFLPFFDGAAEAEYQPEFVQENELKVPQPDVDDPEVRLALKKHKMWDEYNRRCISCGACTMACPTCTCFETRDVIWGENPEVGERRRVEHSCEVPGFDQMAGQREIRSTPAARMRYKFLHKFHDHKARFGTRQMCVGCGRCIHRCPEFISIAATARKVASAVAEIRAGMAASTKA